MIIEISLGATDKQINKQTKKTTKQNKQTTETTEETRGKNKQK